MNKTFIKKAVDDLFSKVNQEMDMEQHEVMEIAVKTCVSSKLETFLRVEATIAPKDIDANVSFHYEKDYDMPKKGKAVKLKISD